MSRRPVEPRYDPAEERFQIPGPSDPDRYSIHQRESHNLPPASERINLPPLRHFSGGYPPVVPHGPRAGSVDSLRSSPDSAYRIGSPSDPSTVPPAIDRWKEVHGIRTRAPPPFDAISSRPMTRQNSAPPSVPMTRETEFNFGAYLAFYGKFPDGRRLHSPGQSSHEPPRHDNVGRPLGAPFDENAVVPTSQYSHITTPPSSECPPTFAPMPQIPHRPLSDRGDFAQHNNGQVDPRARGRAKTPIIPANQIRPPAR